MSDCLNFATTRWTNTGHAMYPLSMVIATCHGLMLGRNNRFHPENFVQWIGQLLSNKEQTGHCARCNRWCAGPRIHENSHPPKTPQMQTRVRYESMVWEWETRSENTNIIRRKKKKKQKKGERNAGIASVTGTPCLYRELYRKSRGGGRYHARSFVRAGADSHIRFGFG